MAKKKPAAGAATTIERVIDPDKIDDYYSNCAYMRTTLQDFTINFGLNHFDDKNNKVVEVYEKAIRMSPQQTKKVFSSLKGLLDDYEKTFGEIKIDFKK